MSRIISAQTYKTYAKKYNIRLSVKLIIDGKTKYYKKSLLELQNEIYKFESLNDDLKDCLYFKNE
jgi:hypothetical protein